jgi:hypothetical protein
MQTNNTLTRKSKENKFLILFLKQVINKQSTKLEFQTNIEDIRNLNDKQFNNIFNAFFNEI